MKHIHFKEIDSTQTKATELAKENNEVLVTAQKQIKGRGRRDNQWLDLDNSLAMSMKLVPGDKPTLLALEVAVLLAEYFHKDDLVLKWPNDIYNRQGQKVAGILVTKNDENYIVGIGINFGPDDNIKDKKFGQLESGYALSPKEYESIPKDIYQYIKSRRLNDSQIITKWNDRCFHLNQNCKIIDDNEILEGLFKGIGQFGEALIEMEGKVEKAYTGSLLFE